MDLSCAGPEQIAVTSLDVACWYGRGATRALLPASLPATVSNLSLNTVVTAPRSCAFRFGRARAVLIAWGA